jgi:hypothetical protein
VAVAQGPVGAAQAERAGLDAAVDEVALAHARQVVAGDAAAGEAEAIVGAGEQAGVAGGGVGERREDLVVEAGEPGEDRGAEAVGDGPRELGLATMLDGRLMTSPYMRSLSAQKRSSAGIAVLSSISSSPSRRTGSAAASCRGGRTIARCGRCRRGCRG